MYPRQSRRNNLGTRLNGVTGGEGLMQSCSNAQPGYYECLLQPQSHRDLFHYMQMIATLQLTMISPISLIWAQL